MRFSRSIRDNTIRAFGYCRFQQAFQQFAAEATLPIAGWTSPSRQATPQHLSAFVAVIIQPWQACSWKQLTRRARRCGWLEALRSAVSGVAEMRDRGVHRIRRSGPARHAYSQELPEGPGVLRRNAGKTAAVWGVFRVLSRAARLFVVAISRPGCCLNGEAGDQSFGERQT